MTTHSLNQTAHETDPPSGGDCNGGSAATASTTPRFPNIRHPWIAILLSLTMPGLGQAYCGQINKSLTIIFLTCVLALLSLAGLAQYATSGALRLLTAAYLPLLLLSVGATIDAFIVARRTRLDYQLKDYNRQSVYTLLLMLGTLSCLAYAFYIKASFLQAFVVPTTSCYPSVVPGDRLLANKRAYDGTEPRRGDLVVFRGPENRRTNLVKRIVALAGDTVEIRNGHLYINGTDCPRQDTGVRTVRSGGKELTGHVWLETNGDATYPIFITGEPEGKAHDMAPLKVPTYHCFVMSDHRSLVPDSRQFGPLQITSITGRADYLYWPTDSWSRFGRLACARSGPAEEKP